MNEPIELYPVDMDLALLSPLDSMVGARDAEAIVFADIVNMYPRCAESKLGSFCGRNVMYEYEPKFWNVFLEEAKFRMLEPSEQNKIST